ncbi:ATP-binding protein [Polyangium sorediatum]|uniref:AAA family ATPase n=1 Tax=Polyangium sorediatum TaxID=889274 RepID=A0ABT6NZD7_9BACT|nr:AAA family ATPase [Polyangium sorediatum]MDI1433651.1 AAA family ATPase [Polyangium sorediatum]
MTFQLPDKRYGREAEVWALLRAFERAATGVSEIVLVSGWAGAGKSTLVEELGPSLVARRGHLVAGKFDQYNRTVPFATLLRALDDLAQRVLGDGEGDDTAEWQERLYDALGEGTAVLVETLPSARSVIGAQSSPSPTSSSSSASAAESQARLEHALLRFLSVFARPEHPLVLFLDDLQWADDASLRFLRAVAGDPSIRNTLLIGAYRDQEVGPEHPVTEAKVALRQRGARLEEIDLPPLGPEHLEAMIADALATTAGPEIQALAAEVHRRTRGNPFFAREFLRFLVQEGFLAEGAGPGAFVWDLAQIRTAPLPEDEVTLIVREMRKLPAETQATLQIAACVGALFDVHDLAAARGTPASEALASLAAAMGKDLVMPVEARRRGDAADSAPIRFRFRFLHDRVRQAAYELIGEEDLPRIRLLVGRRLYADARARDVIDEKLFEFVEHLNAGASLLTDAAERDELARLDLAAGARAKARTAYDAAARYYGTGAALALSGADPALLFALHLGRAECAYLRGQLDEAEALLVALPVPPQTSPEKAAACRVRMAVRTTRGQAASAIDVGLDALAALGLDIPRDEATAKILAEQEHARVRERLSARGLEALAEGAPLEDPDQRAKLEILTNLLAPANLVRPALFSLCAAIQANISLECGHADESIYGYMLYGMHLATSLGRYAEAGAFGKLALRLDERRGSAGEPCRLNFVYGSYAHFLEPIPEVLGYLRKAYRTGLATGDYIYLSYACSHIVLLRLALGDPLKDVDEEAERLLALMERTKVASSIAVQTLVRRILAALAGRTLDVRSLSGDGFDEDTFVASLRERGVHFALSWYRAARITLAFLNGDDEDALVIAGEGGEGAWFYFATDAVYLTALAAARLCAEGASPAEARYATFERNATRIAGWAQACPANFAHKELLLAAERARIAGDHAAAGPLYERAVEAAEASGLTPHVAIAYERAATFFRDRGDEARARSHVHGALDAFARWGADALAERLRQEHADLLLHEVITESEAEARGRPVVVVPFALGALVAEVVLAVAPAFERTRDALQVEQPDELGFMETDEPKVRWLLLCVFGGRALRPRPGSVSFRVFQGREGRLGDVPWAGFEVTDTDDAMDVVSMEDVASVCRQLGGYLTVERGDFGVRATIVIPMFLVGPEG